MAMILTELQGSVATITIDRPKALNALNSEVLSELETAIDALDLDTVRCVILTGSGEKSFVAGADIGEMSTLTKEQGEAFGRKKLSPFFMAVSPSAQRSVRPSSSAVRKPNSVSAGSATGASSARIRSRLK